MKHLLKGRVMASLLTATTLAACGNKNDTSTGQPLLTDSTNANHPHTNTVIAPVDSASTVVRDFLKWYRDNLDSIYGTNTIKGGPADLAEGDSAQNYYVDFGAVAHYLDLLKKSGFFSDELIAAERKRFTDGDLNFKNNPANDGPPDGFDYDPFMRTQDDFETDLKNLDKINFTETRPADNTSEVQFYFPTAGMKYHYTLVHQNGHWLINTIQ